MSFSLKCSNALDHELKNFFQCLEKKYKIPTGSIWEDWTNPITAEVIIKSHTLSTPIQPPNMIHHNSATPVMKDLVKKSNYQVFFSIQRNKIMKENPSMSFGDISKKVSAMWKEVPPEEKKKYVQEENSNENFQHTSMKELKKLCRQYQIDARNMKRENMISALASFTKATPPTTNPKSSTTLTNPIIISSASTSGRSKLELPVDEEKEEDDFYFEAELGSDDEQEEEEDLDEEEDLGEDDLENEDMFEDNDD